MRFADRHKLPALCLVLALAALSPGGSSARPSKGPAGVGAVTLASGTGVKVNGDALDPGGHSDFKGSLRTLYAGDVVAATGNGRAEFTVRVGKKVAFCRTNPALGQVEVSPPSTGALLNFVGGKSFCGTRPTSPRMTMSLGGYDTITMRDPVLEIVVGKSRKVVKVRSGVVVVSGKGGARTAVVVGRNQKTVVPAGKAPQKATPAGALGPSERAAFGALEGVLPKQTDFTAPTVTSVVGPPDGTALRTATFTFAASESGVTFSCSLDRAGSSLCPKRYEGLAAGPHKLLVKATDTAGNTGPARSYAWTIVGGGPGPGHMAPLLGIRGSMPRFAELTGQHSTVGHAIVGWDQGAGWGSPFIDLFQLLGEVPMIGLSTVGVNGKEAITPYQIAQGKGDAYLIALNNAVSTWGKRIYIRPFGEMNGYWTAYCAFTKRGAAKKNHSTADFRRAFARVYLIVHGGSAATINAKLKRLGMPPISGISPRTRCRTRA